MTPTVSVHVCIKSLFDVSTCAGNSSDFMWCQQRNLPCSGITSLVLEVILLLACCEPKCNFRSLINPKCETLKDKTFQSSAKSSTLATAQGKAR